MFGASEGEGHRDMRRQGTLTFDERARKAAVEKAARWTAEQAERLGYFPDEILAAIRRGWTAEEVEALLVASADLLDLSPAKALARIKTGPVLPTRDSGRNQRRRLSRHVSGPCRVAAE